jgi:hypothetical protein
MHLRGGSTLTADSVKVPAGKVLVSMSVSNATYAQIVDYMRDHSRLCQLWIAGETRVVEITGSALLLSFKGVEAVNTTAFREQGLKANVWDSVLKFGL